MQVAIDLAQLVSSIGDAVIVSDAAGLIVFWNPAAERIFGFTEQEALGQSLDLIIPERQRQRHWEGYEVTMRTGQTRYGEDVLRVPALHKDGRNLSIAFTVALLFERPGQSDAKVSAIVAVVRDETERWNEERNLRRRLREAEAKLSGETDPAGAVKTL